MQGAASLNKNEDDLINDTKDAGEDGATSAATVFHEIVPWVLQLIVTVADGKPASFNSNNY